MAAVSRVLSGDMTNLPSLNSRIVRVFTSSTFTDTVEERNYVMENIYPKLKKYCRERHGLEDQVVDMRWGVRDEASDDHMTSSLCAEEIRNCQRLSTGPNFMTLLAQRHGSKFLPPLLEWTEFRTLVDTLSQQKKDVQILDDWYKQDNNSLTPMAVLQPISSKLPEYLSKEMAKRTEARHKWNDFSLQMQQLFREASTLCCNQGLLTEEEKQKYFASVTEDEIMRGILKSSDDPRERCLCFVRIIKDIENNLSHPKAWRFIDMLDSEIDTDAQRQLSNLRDHVLEQKLGAGNIHRWDVHWDATKGISKESHQGYLQQFGSLLYQSLTHKIDKAVAAEEGLSKNELYIEVLQHSKMAEERCSVFLGRQEILEQIRSYLTRDTNQALVVYGSSGSGKTSVMAKCASKVPEWIKANSKPVVILRFLGTSPNSTSIIQTLHSLCQQVSINYDGQTGDPPSDFNECIRYFQGLLEKGTESKPLVIILDSLDQLSADHYAHKLGWLPREVPKYTKVIVSTLPEEHGILEVMQKRIDSKNFIQVPVLGLELSFNILASWLKTSQRTLTQEQIDIVNTAFTKCSYPLYVKLVFEDVLTWRSYTPVAQTQLKYTVRNVISDLFERLEIKHGRVLVTHALAYITASRNGLGEAEIEDILSLDDNVLDEAFQYHVPPFRRIPPLLWVRIQHDVSGYMVSREADDSRVTYWYHRQFIEAAQDRFLKNKQVAVEVHSMLSEYFSGKWYGRNKPFRYTSYQVKKLGLSCPDSLADRMVSPQPLKFLTEDMYGKYKFVRYNKRKLNNLPFHLAQALKLEEMKRECLFNYKWLLTKLVATGIQNVIQDFDLIPEDEEVDLVWKALNLARPCLTKDPGCLPIELTGRLLGYISANNSFNHLSDLIHQCYYEGVDHGTLVVRKQCYDSPGGAVKHSLEDPRLPYGSYLLAYSPDSKHLATLTEKNTLLIWDMVHGEIEQEHVLLPHSDTKLNIMHSNHDGSLLIIGSAFQKTENPVFIVDPSTGDIIHSLKLEKVYPSIGFTDNLQFAISGSKLLVNIVGKNSDCFEIPSGKLVNSFNIQALQMKVTPNGHYAVFIIKNSRNIQIYNMRNYLEAGQCEFDHEPSTIMFTADNMAYVVLYDCPRVLLISLDPTDGAVGKKIGVLDTSSRITGGFQSVTLSRDESVLLFSRKKDVIAWNAKSNKFISKFKCKEPLIISAMKQLNSLSFDATVTPDNKYVIAAYDIYVVIWDLHTGRQVSVVETSKSNVKQLLVANDSKTFVTTHQRNNLVSIWNIAHVQEVSQRPLSFEASVRYLAVSHHSHNMIIRTNEPTGFSVVDVKRGCVLSQPSRQNEAMKPMISRDGKYVVLRDYSAEESSDALKVWDAASGKLVSTIGLSSIRLKVYCLSDDSKMAATHAETSETEEIFTQVWDLQSGKCLKQIQNEKGGVSYIYFASGDAHLVTLQQYPQALEGTNCTIHVYDVSAEKEIYAFKNIHVDSLHVLPAPSDYQILAVQNQQVDQDDPKILIWNLRDGSVLKRFDYINIYKRRLYFNKDITLAIDRSGQVINLDTGEVTVDLSEQVGKKQGATMHPVFTNDGSHIVWVNAQTNIVYLATVDGHVVSKCYIHSGSLAMSLGKDDVVAVGCEDGRLMLLQVIDKDQPGELWKKTLREILPKANAKSKQIAKQGANSDRTRSKLCTVI